MLTATVPVSQTSHWGHCLHWSVISSPQCLLLLDAVLLHPLLQKTHNELLHPLTLWTAFWEVTWLTTSWNHLCSASISVSEICHFSRLPLIRLQGRQKETNNACGQIGGNSQKQISWQWARSVHSIALGITDTQTEAVTHAGKHSQPVGQEEASVATNALTAS